MQKAVARGRSVVDQPPLRLRLLLLTSTTQFRGNFSGNGPHVQLSLADARLFGIEAIVGLQSDPLLHLRDLSHATNDVSQSSFQHLLLGHGSKTIGIGVSVEKAIALLESGKLGANQTGKGGPDHTPGHGGLRNGSHVQVDLVHVLVGLLKLFPHQLVHLSRLLVPVGECSEATSPSESVVRRNAMITTSLDVQCQEILAKVFPATVAKQFMLHL